MLLFHNKCTNFLIIIACENHRCLLTSRLLILAIEIIFSTGMIYKFIDVDNYLQFWFYKICDLFDASPLFLFFYNIINAGSQVTSLHWSKHFHGITSTHNASYRHITKYQFGNTPYLQIFFFFL